MPDVPMLSEPVRALAEIVRAGLNPSRPGTAIDPRLLTLAVRRHRIGPLVHAVAARGGSGLDETTLSSLRNLASDNARRTAVSKLIQIRAIRTLAHAHIPSLVFKGFPLAQLLYPDPTLRHSGDIDLLVSPHEFARALASLTWNGFPANKTLLSGRSPLTALSANLLRDIELRDAVTGQRIELHQRLFFVEPSSGISALDPSFRPRLPRDDNEVPAPELGPGLALYLLSHGALSGWRRLKWPVDLLLLLPRLAPQDAKALANAAEDWQIAASVKAGLAFVQALFDSQLPEPLQTWIKEASGGRSVLRRLRYYTSLLNEPSDARPSPANSRMETLRSLFLLVESPTQRTKILARAPLASALRLLQRPARPRPPVPAKMGMAVSEPPPHSPARRQ